MKFTKIGQDLEGSSRLHLNDLDIKYYFNLNPKQEKKQPQPSCTYQIPITLVSLLEKSGN